jgi:hypothetical protein
MTACTASPFCEVAEVKGVISRACTTLPGQYCGESERDPIPEL